MDRCIDDAMDKSLIAFTNQPILKAASAEKVLEAQSPKTFPSKKGLS